MLGRRPWRRRELCEETSLVAMLGDRGFGGAGRAPVHAATGVPLPICGRGGRGIGARGQLAVGAAQRGGPCRTAAQPAAFDCRARPIGDAVALRDKRVAAGPSSAGARGARRAATRRTLGLVLGPTKTHQVRRVDLGPLDLAALRQRRAHQGARRCCAEGVYTDRGLVFANAAGRSLQVNTVSPVGRGGVRAGLPPTMQLHDLRHTHASLLSARGHGLPVVSVRLCHRTIVTNAKPICACPSDRPAGGGAGSRRMPIQTRG